MGQLALGLAGAGIGFAFGGPTGAQIGIDDCSTDLALRGLPVFRGLIGPMPEGKTVIRYETPEVFESLTKEWSSAKSNRSCGRGDFWAALLRHPPRATGGRPRAPR